jgi:PAS domain-containing protein
LQVALTVEPADQPRPKTLLAETSKRSLNLASLGLIFALAILLVAIRVANFQSTQVTLALWISLISAVLLFALSSANVIRQLRRTERQAKRVFEDSEEEFHQMADNIQEIFWVIDAETRKATYINPAYETITGRSCRSLFENPSSHENTIHPGDRVPFTAITRVRVPSGTPYSSISMRSGYALSGSPEETIFGTLDVPGTSFTRNSRGSNRLAKTCGRCK